MRAKLALPATLKPAILRRSLGDLWLDPQPQHPPEQQDSARALTGDAALRISSRHSVGPDSR